jgi:hypothetical protein
MRDGFCDRYSGDRLIFSGVLRVLSDLFPLEFQWHPNWKIGACHNFYWLLQPTIDHIVPNETLYAELTARNAFDRQDLRLKS